MEVYDGTHLEIGVIGLAPMGWQVACRLAERNFKVAACDSGPNGEWRPPSIMPPGLQVKNSVAELMAGLRQPRVVLVFSGLEPLWPELKAGDIVFDAGNSHFNETARRESQWAERSIQGMGLGLGGGENGARHGAAVMAGGGREACGGMRPLLEAMAATVRGELCLACFETAAAAHFVKMVHTGIEYALLQSLAEIFDLLQRALRWTDKELHEVSGGRRLGVLAAHLLEISGRMADSMGQPELRALLQEQMNLARNDPIGKWLAQSSWEWHVPMPAMEVSAGIHRVSAVERRQALEGAAFRRPVRPGGNSPKSILDELHGAFQAATIMAYAQGFALLAAAAEPFGFNLSEISGAWRGCAHLRASLLDDFTAAFRAMPELPNLLSDDNVSERVMSCQEHLRQAVCRADGFGLAIPALRASLDYFDFQRTAWLPMNLVYAARTLRTRKVVRLPPFLLGGAA